MAQTLISCLFPKHPNAVPIPPVVDESSLAGDYGWYKDYSSCDSDDGVPITANNLNKILTFLCSPVEAALSNGMDPALLDDCANAFLNVLNNLYGDDDGGGQVGNLFLCSTSLDNYQSTSFGGQGVAPKDGYVHVVVNKNSPGGSDLDVLVPVSEDDVIAYTLTTTTGTVNCNATINGSNVNANSGIDQCYFLSNSVASQSQFFESDTSNDGSASGSIEVTFYC